MELTQLHAFVAVAEESHFGRAAERLYLSPPALTYRIHQLERTVGVPLFERLPVALTEAGAALLPHAYETLRQSEAALDAVRPFRDGRAGRLRVGIMSHGAGTLTQKIIETFVAASPDVELSVHALDFTQHVSALVDRYVDVSFVRPRLDDDRLQELVLTEEQRVAVLPSRDARAEADLLNVDDLADDVFIDIPEEAPGSYGDFLFLAADRNEESPRRSRYRGRTAEELLTGVAAGFGVATTITSFPAYYPWYGVAYVPLSDATVAHTSLVRRVDDESPVVESFAAAAAAVRGKLADREGTRALTTPL